MMGKENLTIIQEHMAWHANQDVMYDVIKSESLEWPTQTVQWLKGVEAGDDESTIQRLLFGTQTSGQEQEYLLIANVRVPKAQDEDEDEEDTDEKDPTEAPDDKKEICITGFQHRLPHDKEINKARAMPQNEDLIATKSNSGTVYLFNLKGEAPAAGATSAHQVVMEGTMGEGYGLAWNPFQNGYLLSADDCICCWDTTVGSRDKPLAPLFKDEKVHTDAVEDVVWLGASLFASVADDKTLRIWDMRAGPKATSTVEYTSNLNALGFHAEAEQRLLTGAADGKVLQWDLRKLAVKDIVHTFVGHSDEVFVIQCAPFHVSVFASAGYDRAVYVWDMDKIGQAVQEDDDEEVVPELVFQHGGHTSRVLDISWNPNPDDAWVMSSVQESNNVMHIWKPLQDLLIEDEDEEEEDEEDEEAQGEPVAKRQKVQ
jgi:histone-binding protein RBBP4